MSLPFSTHQGGTNKLDMLCTAFAVLAAARVGANQVPSLPAAYNLRTEYLDGAAAIGVTEALPRFSWSLPSFTSLSQRGLSQRAYRIQVIDRDTGTSVWDSGRVTSNSTVGVVYAGKPLVAQSAYNITHTWWSSNDNTSISAPTTAGFDMGPMTESDWGSAAWLGSGQERQFRVEFALPADARVSRARLHVDAPGCAVTFINGNLVGPASGNCPWTQFSQTVLFTTRDATAAVQPGKNAIGIVLGHGTFHHSTGSPPRLRAMLFVTMRDGTTRSVVTTGGAPLPPPPPPPPPPGAFCGSANEHAVLTLACQSPTQTIKSVTFASFGTPTGTCVDPGTSSNNSFAADPQCNANVEAYVGQACIGKHSCTLSPQCKMRKCVITPSGPSVADPCRMQKKHLDVAVKCGGPDRRVGAAAAAAAAGTAWSASQGPIISDDPWLGTTTNWTVQAGNAAAKWTEPGFDAASAVQPWIPAGTAAPVNPVHPRRSAGSLLTQDVQRIPAEAAWSGDNDSCIVKFPENFVGVVAVQIPGYVAITGAGNITLRHSEVLMPGNKSVDLDYSWGNQDTHIFSDAKIEPLAELRPRFTWHGFQFVQVQAAGSVSVKCAKEAFVGVNTITPLRSVGSVYFDEKSGGPAPMLNQLQSMVVKGQASNVAAGMPTDCPTREKHGWLGDAQVTVDEAMYNFDMAAVYTEFLNTIRDNQKADGDVPGVVPVPGKHQRASSATAAAVPSYGGMFAESALEIGSGSLKKGPFTDISWSSAYPLIADAMFKYYGDLRVVQRHWSTMDAFMQGLLNGAANGACTGGLPSFFTWGDWCATEPRSKDTKDTGAELAAANYIFSMDAMANMASALGKGAEAAAYAANATRLRSVFHSVFYNNQTKSYAPNNATLQTLAAASLALGGSAIPGELHTSVAASLNQNVVDLGYHHTVGAVGAKLLLPQLSANGFAETAMKVATQTTFPSFGYWMSQGATTCWENWSGVPDPTHPPPPTHNHIFLCGGLGKWLYQSIGGIAPGDHTDAGNGGGYENVMINPDVTVSGPASSSTLIDTVRGKVLAEWTRGDRVQDLLIQVTVPPGVASAAVVFKDCGHAHTITEGCDRSSGCAAVWSQSKGFVPGVNGVVSAMVGANGRDVVLTVLSGSYYFQAQ